MIHRAFHSLVFVVLSLCPSGLFADAKSNLSLTNAFELAKKQSEKLGQSRDAVEVAKARYEQALAAIYPSVTASANQRIRDTATGQNVFNSTGGSSDNTVRSSSKHPFGTTISVQQPIFAGFRDVFLYQAAKFEERAKEYDAYRVEELLFQDVAEAFLQVRLFEEDRAVLVNMKRTLVDRIAELKHFIELGKSRDSEELAAKADLADVESTLVQTEKMLATSREALAFLTGQPASVLTLSNQPVPPNLEPLDALIERAKHRADLLAAAQRLSSAERQTKASHRERWPSISLQGNVYPYENPNNESDWDLLFRAELPIFDGGAISGRVHEREAIEHASSLAATEAMRTAETEVRTAFIQRKEACRQVSVLEDLYQANNNNLAAQRREYKLGVVTNLDVLESIRQIQNAQRRKVAAIIECQLESVRLTIAAGGPA